MGELSELGEWVSVKKARKDGERKKGKERRVGSCDIQLKRKECGCCCCSNGGNRRQFANVRWIWIWIWGGKQKGRSKSQV